MEKQKSKWDINLEEKVLCPDCGTEQPAVRAPKNFHQFVFGGWTCKNCSCNMNKHGDKIMKKYDEHQI